MPFLYIFKIQSHKSVSILIRNVDYYIKRKSIRRIERLEASIDKSDRSRQKVGKYKNHLLMSSHIEQSITFIAVVIDEIYYKSITIDKTSAGT